MSDKERMATEEAMAMSDEKQERSRKGVSGVIFVGCLMLGLALGFFLGNMATGLFVGLGVGFIAMGVTRHFTGEW